MKVKQLTVKNIGMIADAVISIDQPLMLFYGDIKQGKTTLLNAIRWVFGGSFPSDILRHGEPEGMIRLDLDCGHIERTFYVSKDGTTKARTIEYVLNGIPVKNPVKEIEKLLNPFLLDQNHLVNMSEYERRKYFSQLFAVESNVQGIDAQVKGLEAEAVGARAVLKQFGDIDLTPVPEPANITALQVFRRTIIDTREAHQRQIAAELQEVRREHQQKVEQVASRNLAATTRNQNISGVKANTESMKSKVEDIDRQIAALQISRLNAVQSIETNDHWLADNHPVELEPTPPAPDTAAREAEMFKPADTAEIDAEIIKCHADTARYTEFLRLKTLAAQRATTENTLQSLDANIRSLRAKRIAKLKEISDACGIAFGLSFDDECNFVYDGVAAGMLSTSQLMELSSRLSALYPAGFGLDLIDRGESLGASIFSFIERAKREDKTILATIVGERPAAVPEGVGVFVVQNGEVK